MTVCLSIQVNTGDEFFKAVCNMKNSTRLCLDPSIDYEISRSPNESCVVSGNYSLVIESSDQNRFVNVTCINQTSEPVQTIGFAFVNMSVTISQVIFENCGTQLKSMNGGGFVNKSINPTGLFLASYHSAFLVLLNCTVNFTQVNITSYYGFAIVAVDLVSAQFTELGINSNLGVEVSIEVIGKSIGTGVLVVYTNSSAKNVPASVAFKNSTFYANYDYDGKNNTAFCFRPCFKRIHNAAGLTIFSYATLRKVSINISGSLFHRNFGTYASGVMIVLVNTNSTFITINKETRFESNMNLFDCPGGALGFYGSYEFQQVPSNGTVTPLIVTDTHFTDHNGITGDDLNFELFRHGTVYAMFEGTSTVSQYALEFTGVTFIKNYADWFASCLFVKVIQSFHSPVTILLKDLTVSDNQQTSFYSFSKTGLFVFVNVRRVYFAGSSSFCGNTGSVIRSYNSHIYLNNMLTFLDNKAESGAALNIINAHLNLQQGLKLILYDNTALRIGGAVYISNTAFEKFPQCALKFLANYSSITVIVKNNTASNGGNLVFAFPMYSCYHNNTFVNSTDFYLQKLQPLNTSLTGLDVSSAVNRLHLCSKHQLNVHYPGERIQIPLLAYDAAESPVYSQIHVSLKRLKGGDIVQPTSSHLQIIENYQVIKANNICSNISATISYFDQGAPNHSFVLFLSPVRSGSDVKKVLLNLSQCPFGFALENGRCECSPAVKRLHKSYSFISKCWINSRTIPKPAFMLNPWFGNYTKSNDTGSCGNRSHSNVKCVEFALSYSCPSEFCTSSLEHRWFYFDDTTNSFYLTNSSNRSNEHDYKALCRKNRDGVLCGKCVDGSSVVFGTGDCERCTDEWLWTILLYGLAGPVLIYFIYLLRLTVTAGTLNGIIFFAQTANVGVLEVMLYYQDYQPWLGKILYVFLSLLNLNLGFSLCFYKGMTEFVKTGLSMAFPLYLLLISFLLIIASRYSTRLSNKIAHSSVQVLVTVVHLSFSKLLLVTIDVFTPIHVYTDTYDTLVWYRSGEQPFGFHNTSLIVLMSISIIITSVFLIPYMVLLVGGKCLIRSSFGDKYFRSAYDSIHGPYRDTKKYWFVVRFLLLLLLYLIFACFRGYSVFLICIITLPLLITFTIFQVYLRPFKSKVLNLLDTAIMLDLVIIYMMAWGVIFDLRPMRVKRCMIVLSILLFFIFFLFVCVIVYHVALVTSCWEKVTTVWRIRTNDHTNFEKMVHSRNPHLSSDEANGSFYDSCGSYREPVARYL